jgi:hypothetical protein
VVPATAAPATAAVIPANARRRRIMRADYRADMPRDAHPWDVSRPDLGAQFDGAVRRILLPLNIFRERRVRTGERDARNPG